MNGGIIFLSFIIFALIITLFVWFSKDANKYTVTNTGTVVNGKTYLRKTSYFKEEDITKYNWLDFSIKEVSFPEEPIRYYAVVTVTGHNLGDCYANVIIRKVIRKDDIDYDFNPHYEGYSDDYYPCMDTYDEVLSGLEIYFQAKKRHEDPNRHSALKENYYYFNSKEEAAEAICAIKKKIDGFYRDKELSTEQITENEIKITFEK